MFTGIVEERGAVRSLEGSRLTVGCELVTEGSPIGASVAVSGTCLTVVVRGEDHLGFDLSEETLARTALGRARPGDAVNLERPVTLAARLGGHLVQGHVDGLGEVLAHDREGDGGSRLRLRVPAPLRRYTVEKGSITLDGVSLTIAEVHSDGVSIALIPHTRDVTTLGALGPGDAVAIEVDVFARYAERLLTEGTTP
ncbi:MAG TPA: riboflavin synthase [Actinomycetota bacterium]|nr:riboflavin synthase [Actinomycetota bacterium]